MKAHEIIKKYREDPVLFVRKEFKVEPDDWQKVVLSDFAKKGIDRISMQACSGPGKGCSASTKIETPDGLRLYGDLRVGDRVFSENGLPTRISAIVDWGTRDFYRVTFSDGSHCDVSDKHIWKVQSRHFKDFNDWNIAETDLLCRLGVTKIYEGNSGTRKVRKFRIPIQGAVHFTENDKDIALPLDPYLLGLWLGDGSRKSSAITKNDNEPFDYLKKLGYKISYGYRKYAGDSWVVKGLITKLKKIGISDLYSGQRYLPDLYKYSSSRQRKEILRGLMDTDGRIKLNGMMDFHSTSKKLIDDFVWLSRSIGQYAHCDRVVDTHKETSNCYTASIRTDFNPFRIKRKGIRWKLPPSYKMYRYIDSIEKIERDRCVCIEIDHPSHCYLANDFIVTHNSSVLAWCGWNFLLCYAEPNEHPKGAAVSMTWDNLRDNLWAELSKWRSKSELLTSQFEWTSDRIFQKDYPETWFISSRSWPKSANVEEQGRVLSGIHSKFVLFLIDESGDIPVQVLKSAEQALSNCEFGKILQAGNPTSHDGMLYAAATRLKEHWKVVKITSDPDDPIRTPRVSKEWASDQIKLYGRDDPWVKSYILGDFPESGINTLLSIEEIEKSMNRSVGEASIEHAQKRIGVDVARQGLDSTYVVRRQGLVMFEPLEMRLQKSNEIAGRVALIKGEWGSEYEFIDGTGGFGGGVVDSLLQHGLAPYEIHFSSKAEDSRFYNKRSEMWFRMAEWVKRGGCLYKSDRLKKELSAPQYSFNNGKFLLEPKDNIKKRLGFSPDMADALCLTFALKEMPSMKLARNQYFSSGKAKIDYDPLGDRDE